jgi:Uma2 family endonuclease
MLWLGTYCLRDSQLILEDNATVFLEDRSEVQPDACVWWPEPGGPHLTDDGYVEGAPQFVFEVAASSASYDLHDKLEAYRRNGVREYVVWRVLDGVIDWLCLHESQYVRLEPDADGVIESRLLPGLRLHVPSMLVGDRTAVVAGLR